MRKTPTMKLVEIHHGEPIDQLLSRLYVDEGKTIGEIGKVLGVSESAICRWLERCGIPTRGYGDEQAATAEDPNPGPVSLAAGH